MWCAEECDNAPSLAAFLKAEEVFSAVKVIPDWAAGRTGIWGETVKQLQPVPLTFLGGDFHRGRKRQSQRRLGDILGVCEPRGSVGWRGVWW